MIPLLISIYLFNHFDQCSGNLLKILLTILKLKIWDVEVAAPQKMVHRADAKAMAVAPAEVVTA